MNNLNFGNLGVIVKDISEHNVAKLEMLFENCNVKFSGLHDTDFKDHALQCDSTGYYTEDPIIGLFTANHLSYATDLQTYLSILTAKTLDTSLDVEQMLQELYAEGSIKDYDDDEY